MTPDTCKEHLHRCFRCGYCKLPADYQEINCPSYRQFPMESFSPGGRLWLIRAVTNGEIQPSRHYADILYSCMMCGNCREHCCLEFRDEILNMLRAARSELVDQSILPAPVQAYFETVYRFGNPWKKSRRKRQEWATGAGIGLFESPDQYLLYLGDTASFHPRACAVSRTIGRLLQLAGIPFGILGPEEMCDGNEARDMGETALFEHFRDKNTQLFKERGVQKIITYSPHAFHVMKNHYRELAAFATVSHHLELVETLLSEKRLNFSETPGIKVTYHDSCFLGRRNSQYDLPRKVLSQIPFVDFVEMERKRENSFCCGGGNGNFFTDLPGGGKNSPSRVRVREALATGARVIAVSCPVCLVMLEEAVLSEGVRDEIRVLDIVEILASGLTFN